MLNATQCGAPSGLASKRICPAAVPTASLGRRRAAALVAPGRPAWQAPHRRSPAVTAAGAAASAPARTAGPPVPKDALPRVPPGTGPVVVWFKHDLRVGDHPGLLAAAATGRPVAPLFCLDPDAYADLALQPCGPKALADAIAALRTALRALGSDLAVRIGPIDRTVAEFAASIGADTILTEREVEARWLESKHKLSAALRQRAPSARVAAWSAPLYPAAAHHPNFRTWRRSRGAALPPLPPPAALLAAPAGADAGPLPSAAEVESLLRGALAAGVGDEAARRILSAITESEAAAATAADAGTGSAERRRQPVSVRAAPYVQQLLAAIAPSDAAAAGGSSTSESSGDGSGGGAAPASAAAPGAAELSALRAYLGAPLSAPLPGSGLSFLSEAVAALEGPANPGGSFLALLGRPLVRLGRLSARQVHWEALEFERRRWGGRLPPLGPATPTARAALDASELSEFHTQLAAIGKGLTAAGAGKPSSSSSSASLSASSSAAAGAGAAAKAAAGAALAWAPDPVASVSESVEEGDDGAIESWGVAAAGAAGGWPAGVPRRCAWRWRGALTDYCVADPPAPRAGAPAIVLCHGFGAFGDQWRGNLGALAAAGYRVYAPTLPGFGRSEKAAIGYSQEAWRDYLRDFTLRVVGGPCVLVGNSIGGFISASVAADYPDLVKGLVLVNSAGPIDPKFDIEAHARATKSPPPAWLAGALTAGLMAYLECSIAGQLKWLYPTAPERADTWLEQEIFRAACDGRSPDVFRSVFYLPPPRALNWMVKDAFKGPTLVLQGVLDPLNDAKGRMQQMAALCPNVETVELRAGHCPQDEQPDALNQALLAWIEGSVLAAAQGGGAVAAAV